MTPFEFPCVDLRKINFANHWLQLFKFIFIIGPSETIQRPEKKFNCITIFLVCEFLIISFDYAVQRLKGLLLFQFTEHVCQALQQLGTESKLAHFLGQ